MRYSADLIFDVGMNNGDDTAYYLHKGFRVVAIDANPSLIPPARQRFAREIAAGRLTILNVGITNELGEADFFISLKNDVWGSFDRQIAGRVSDYATVRVPCVPFAAILQEFGVPHYLKIDIEGNDKLCLEALSPAILPPYISIEMSDEAGDQDILRLRELGYDKFKCIRQNDFRLISPSNVVRQIVLRRLRAKGGVVGVSVRVLRRLTKIGNRTRDGQWLFRFGSSGRFGTGLPGDWVRAHEMLKIWGLLHDIDVELQARGRGEWFDIHAAK